ncbi:hypothetical protein ACHAXR_007129 [Thalassiosira sp. AJA248-18]
MYLLGPILIALASSIIVGLTYVYFRVILPMLAGTNWVFTNDDWNQYYGGYGDEADHGQSDNGSMPISQLSSTFLALSTPTGIFHTLIISFFLVNILYNYYQCVKTSNTGPRYDVVVRELAEVTGFHYPQTEAELVQCKKDFERKIYEKAKQRRDEMMAAAKAAENAPLVSNGASSSASAPLGTTAQAKSTRNGDEESQISLSSPLLASSSTTTAQASTALTAKKAPLKLPKIHNWMLLSPIEWGYCRYSSHPKPPRSHYDHVIKANVLNMDHYCPWMFNCIGYFNYRYFFNFLWFVATALLYGTAICFPAFMKLGSHDYRSQVRASGGFQKPLKSIVVRHIRANPFIPTPDERTPVALGFMLCLCLGAAVMCLGGFHLYLVLSAQTTIEFHGNFSKRRKGGWTNPYSAGGWKRNWEMIYGTRYWSRHNTGENSSQDEDQYRYSGCCGILAAMMPSNREPEFLPLPIDGKLVRRKNNRDLDVESDLEMGSDEAMSSNETGSSTTTEEVEFLMESKNNERLVGRSRTNKTSAGRIV